MRTRKLDTGIVTFTPSNGGKIKVETYGMHRLKYSDTYKSFKELRNDTTNLQKTHTD